MRLGIGLVALVVAAMATPEALACRGVFAEIYALRPTPPQPAGLDEIVLEVEATPETFSVKMGDVYPFKVKRVVAGAYEGQTVLVQVSGTSCSRLLFESTDVDVFVAGKLAKAEDGSTVLVARMQPYPDRMGLPAQRTLLLNGVPQN